MVTDHTLFFQYTSQLFQIVSRDEILAMLVPETIK